MAFFPDIIPREPVVKRLKKESYLNGFPGQVGCSRSRLIERGYHDENISSHHGAHNGSDIFCQFHHLVGRSFTDPGAKKVKLEKTSVEKTAGVTGDKKDRRVAETEPEEQKAKIDAIIARPP
jgi:hypothetical protein